MKSLLFSMTAAQQIQENIKSLEWKILSNLSNSFDLAPKGFPLFRSWEPFISGMSFRNKGGNRKWLVGDSRFR